jgi:hypothetical protein
MRASSHGAERFRARTATAVRCTTPTLQRPNGTTLAALSTDVGGSWCPVFWAVDRRVQQPLNQVRNTKGE